MEKLQKDIEGKVKLLLFTLAKTQEILESRNELAINRHRQALSTIVKQVDTLELQVVEEKFKQGESNEDIAKWSEEIEHQVAQVDAKVTYFNKHLATQEDFEAKETEKALKAKEPKDQLKFERAQFEQKLEFELKVIQEELRNEIKRSQSKRGAAHKTAQTDYH